MHPDSVSSKVPARRGFAAMDKDRQREIARKGGASVPDEKRSFSRTATWPPRPGAKAAKPRTAGAGSADRNPRARLNPPDRA